MAPDVKFLQKHIPIIENQYGNCHGNYLKY